MNMINKLSGVFRSSPTNTSPLPSVLKSKRDTPTAHPVRAWSNRELAKVAHLFPGHVVNVSGWQDKDKEGRLYKDYFKQATDYTVTNYSPSHSNHHANEIALDLEKNLPRNLHGKFDVVLSHTNLEHIFNVFKAFENHCLMTKDIVIVIVPFIQQQHETDEYKDYWRFTPSCLRALFEMNGLSTIYEAYNDEPHQVTYLLFVGSKLPEKWTGKLPKYTQLQQICNWVS